MKILFSMGQNQVMEQKYLNRKTLFVGAKMEMQSNHIQVMLAELPMGYGYMQRNWKMMIFN